MVSISGFEKRARILAALVVVAVAGYIASVAEGGSSPRAAHLVDPRGDNGASFTRDPTDLTGLDIVWDGSVLTVTARYAATPPSYRMTLLLAADATSDPTAASCLPNDADSINIRASATGAAQLTMPFIQGSLTADATIAGATATYVFTHKELTEAMARGRDPFTCVSGDADGDHVYGAFDGKVLHLTPKNATAALNTLLEKRFGTSFRAAPRKWVVCPKDELFAATSTSSETALCAYEFGHPGGSYTGGETELYLANGVIGTTAPLRASTYRKTLKRCTIERDKRGWANGAYLSDRTLVNSESLGVGSKCARLVGPAGMAADVEYAALSGRTGHVTVGEHGTNRAGFEAHTLYRCRVAHTGARFNFDCRNALGDRFIYSFTVHR